MLNRFLMQAAIGHPLTVHGTGGQTRAFIHIKDTAACVEIAISHPPEAGDRPMVLNQVTETHLIIDLAKLVADTTGGEIAAPTRARSSPARCGGRACRAPTTSSRSGYRSAGGLAAPQACDRVAVTLGAVS